LEQSFITSHKSNSNSNGLAMTSISVQMSISTSIIVVSLDAIDRRDDRRNYLIVKYVSAIINIVGHYSCC
jgi:hypothetical protein